MVFFTSDWHFNHNKEFCYKFRGFDSAEQMNETIIERHNSIVEPEDDVYVLGDCALGGSESNDQNKSLIERLNGKLHIIFGNHDTKNRISMYTNCINVVEICGYSTVIKKQKYTLYLSHYPAITSNFDDNVPLKQRVICLHGHTHQTTNFYNESPLLYHVGVDSHNCFPVSFDTVIEDIKNKIENMKQI